jgi:lipopolysaccharide export LptBFGC system permease protein LptF
MHTTQDLKRIIARITAAPLNQLAGCVVGARGSRIVRTALAGTALAALIAFVAAIQPTPHAQAATAKVAMAESSAAHIRTVADGFLGDIVAMDDDDDLVQQQEEEQQQEEQDEEQATQQQLQTDQEIQEAEQEAEEQNELATQEAQQAEQQGLTDEQQATLSGGR